MTTDNNRQQYPNRSNLERIAQVLYEIALVNAGEARTHLPLQVLKDTLGTLQPIIKGCEYDPKGFITDTQTLRRVAILYHYTPSKLTRKRTPRTLEVEVYPSRGYMYIDGISVFLPDDLFKEILERCQVPRIEPVAQ